VSTHREVTANRPDVITKNRKERTCMLIDVAVPADRNATQKKAGNRLTIQEFMYRDTNSDEYEMYEYTGNKWSQVAQ
jgi:hypothetical protein